MRSDWPIRKVSDIADFLNYRRVPLKSLDRQKRKGEYPYYGASGIVDYINDYIFDGTYLLISEDGENLRTRNTPIAFKATGKFWVNNHAHILAEKEVGILDYLEYYFSQLDLSPYITGAVQPKLNKSNLDSIEIPVPEIKERLAINKILNSMANKIELNRQTNQTLEQIAQAIFKSWFVDFDPVKAKIAAKQNGQDPELAAICAISGKTEEQLKALDNAALQQLKTTAALFPDALVESELGEVPEGWEVGLMKDCCIRVESGGTPKRSEYLYWGGCIKWLSSGEVRDVIAIDTKERITKLGLEKSAAKLWPKGSTVVAMYGATAGQVCFLADEMAANQACCALIPKSEYESFMFLAARRSIEDLAGKASGSAQQNLNKSLVAEHRIVIPSDVVAEEFEKVVSVLIEKWINSIVENNKLSELRDTLLPKLLSGEITFDNKPSRKEAEA